MAPVSGRLRGGVLLSAVLLVALSCSSGDSGPEPIVVGMINQEGSPSGSFPDVREAAQAAVDHVNADQGGVAGRPLRLETCETTGSPESSQACASQLVGKKPVAVVGGVDLGAAASLPILADAGIPYLGGSPTLGDELTSSTAFLLTAGIAGDLLGQAKYITETLHYTNVGVLHIDLPGLLATAVEAARQVLQKKGVTDVNLVAEKADAADFTVALNAVNARRPQAIVVVFPPESCSRVMQAAQALDIEAAMFYPGVCAQEAVLETAGEGAAGAYFASGYLSYDDEVNFEVATYRQETGAGDGGSQPSALSQAGFGAVMDLVALLKETGPDPAALTKRLEATRDQPGFMSHAYTCDRGQVPLLPAICNVNVRILQERQGRLVDVVGDWVNGGDLIRLFTE